jgi:hypothetical protein
MASVTFAAHQRRLVGGRDHHNRAGKTGIAEVFLHFAAAVADQPESRHLDHQAAYAYYPAIDIDAVEFINLSGERLHGRACAPGRSTFRP